MKLFDIIQPLALVGILGLAGITISAVTGPLFGVGRGGVAAGIILLLYLGFVWVNFK